MSAFSYKNPPKLRPIPRGGSALVPVATNSGWCNPVTGEVLVAIGGLIAKRADAIVVPTFTLAVPANATYLTGQVMTFTLTASEAVVVTGTPSILITLTSGTRYAVYDAVNSTGTSLLFKYTVVAGDTDANGIVVANTLTLSESTASKNKDAVIDAIAGTGGEKILAAALTYTVPSTTLVLVAGV